MNRWGAWLLFLAGCGPGPTTTTATPQPPPTAEVSPEPAPPVAAHKALPGAMRGIAADARFIGFVDLQAMHGWPAEDAMFWAIDEMFDEVVDADSADNAAARECLLAVVRNRPQVAFGSRARDSGRLEAPVFVIELDELEPERVISCVRDAAPEASSDPIAGLPTVREGTWGRAATLVATPRLLFGGQADQLEKTVAQIHAPSVTDGLFAKLPRDGDVVVAFAGRDAPPVAGFSGAIRREGNLLSGEMTLVFDDEHRANDIEQGLRKERTDTIGQLASHFGAGHAFITALQGARIERDGATITGSGEFTGYRGLKAEILAKIAEREHRNRNSEAKQVIGAISRGAAAAFEREHIEPNGKVHPGKLCKSAIDVPRIVPKGVKYQPSAKDGEDFETGNESTGWRCLKFAMTESFAYRYSYRQGGNYKGPARGGPDPGPNGYEVSAEGDLDGDGKTSFFSVIGTVDKKTGKLTRSTQAFIVDGYE